MAREDLIYLAATLDCDGSFGLGKTPCGSFVPVICVGNTNPVLTSWLKDSFGGTVALAKSKYPDRQKPTFYWRVRGKAAVELAELVVPYLKLKTAQAETILAFWRLHESWGVGGGKRPYWGYDVSAQALKEAMSILNRKGPK